MTSTPMVTVVIATNNQTLLNINMTNVTKLTQVNYIMWKLQVCALVDGYGLVGHLDGSTMAPTPTITVDDVATPDPVFVLWKRQDILVYSALLGAISHSVQYPFSQESLLSLRSGRP